MASELISRQATVYHLYERLTALNDYIKSIRAIGYLMTAMCEVEPLHLSNDDISDVGMLITHLTGEMRDTSTQLEEVVDSLNEKMKEEEK